MITRTHVVTPHDGDMDCRSHQVTHQVVRKATHGEYAVGMSQTNNAGESHDFWGLPSDPSDWWRCSRAWDANLIIEHGWLDTPPFLDGLPIRNSRFQASSLFGFFWGYTACCDFLSMWAVFFGLWLVIIGCRSQRQPSTTSNNEPWIGMSPITGMS